MSIALYLLAAISFYLIISQIFEKLNFWLVIFSSLFLANISHAIGTDNSCASGWISASIGKRGACSSHGGVVSNINEIGILMIVVFIIYLGVIYYKKHNEA
ncbi:hypothetical protein ACTL6P_24720 [Endozoicomonas acroporae]|uniref:hypothetical protein n=1 Tax=Endozoicomonas acroporae TaxID=1701104 RepID=UPI0011AFA4DF|nr:hypothetical protein [Endozoicomonas acroporae]